MPDHPFVSIVIPVWNSPDLIARCLTSIAQQDYPADRVEVLVVDNASTDRTPDVVRGFRFATLLSEPIPSSYRARNRGLAAAKGDYVCFIDADCRAAPDWLSAAMAAAGRRPDFGVLAGRVDLFRDGESSSEACELFEAVFGFNQKSNAAKGVSVTANWVSPRTVLAELGGFDSGLKSGGDFELARRIAATGRPVIYVDEMRVEHPIRGDWGALIGKRRRIVGGFVQDMRGPADFLRKFGGIGADALRKARAVAMSGELSLAQKLRVLPLILVIWLAGLSELVRIACGGEPRRA